MLIQFLKICLPKAFPTLLCSTLMTPEDRSSRTKAIGFIHYFFSDAKQFLPYRLKLLSFP